MRSRGLIVVVIALLGAGCATRSSNSSTQASNATPLILEKNQGERRITRGWPGHPYPGAPFLLKVDPRNGGSAHLVLGTEDLGPGEAISPHRHPNADEILLLETGTTRVQVGEQTREVHGGATIFIPANTVVSATNIGKDPVSLVFIFSAPGFEEFMRESSVRQGEKNVALSKDEDDALQRKHAHSVVYQ